jgi:S-adenosylmethionine:tRNA ribosyltransferase-isomerase
VDLTELDYALPDELIAQRPLASRDAARMLVLDRRSGTVRHAQVRDLPQLVPPSLWVVNDTRVIPSRLFGRRTSGGRVELLLVSRRSDEGNTERWLALGRANKPLRVGTALELDGAMQARVLAVLGDGTLEVEIRAEEPIARALERSGHVPLPPYVRRPDETMDRERYQTVFADRPGAVAAPTAGLHFSERLIAELEGAGHRIARITLHVGPGTFRPVKTERLDDHPMHAEHYEVSADAARAISAAKAEGIPIAAVGTTVVRTLETVSVEGGVRAAAGATDLFVRPPFEFRTVGALLTNFHLPRSTLLALVMAFGGIENVRAAYAEAVRERYRFFSYGDAMFIGEVRA